MAKVVFGGLAVVVACAALAVTEDAAAVGAGAAYGRPEYPRDGIGSVIRSWSTPAGTNARACCEAGGYVIVNTYYNPQYVCTPAGSLARSHNISLGTGWRDSSRCHLGTGYYAIIRATSPYTVAFVNFWNGSVAGSFNATSMSPFPMNLAYDANAGYYYANGYSENSFARRYDTSGSLAGSIKLAPSGSYCGALGWTPRVNGVRGSYIWASNFGYTGRVICTTAGSLVASWSGPEGACGGDCGKHHASAARVVWELGGARLEVYEIDLGNGTAVAPASLGQVKALYR